MATTCSLKFDRSQLASQLNHYLCSNMISERALFPEAPSMRGFVTYGEQVDVILNETN